MAKAQKLKRKNKMSPETKAIIGNSFRGIISNEACIENGKNAPWWLGAIFFVVSVLLPLIPIMVSASNSYGSAFMDTTYNYGSKEGLYQTSLKLRQDGYQFNVDNQGIMTFYKAGVELDGADLTAENPVASYTYLLDETKIDSEVYGFNFYITNLKGDALNERVDEIVNTKYECGTMTKYDESKKEQYEEEGTQFYIPSFIILTTQTSAMAVIKQQTTTQAATSMGGLDWQNSKGQEILSVVIPNLSEATKENTYTNWKSVFNATYLTQKSITFRNTTLVYAGIYVVLIFFMGLMVFILTRGKTNPFKFMSFLTTQKIAWFAAFTPSILGMILAFIFPANVLGQMGFVVLIALRVMWLSMKQLRPM